MHKARPHGSFSWRLTPYPLAVALLLVPLSPARVATAAGVQPAHNAASAAAAEEQTAAQTAATVADAPTAPSPPPATSSPHPAGSPAPADSPSAPMVESRAVLSALDQLLGWYSHLAVEQELATEPAETIFVADDRQMAAKVLALGFEYARAAAKLLQDQTVTTNASATAVLDLNTAAPPAGGTALSTLIAQRAAAQAEADATKAHIQQLRDELTRVGRTQREPLQRQLVTVQTQLTLTQSRIDAISALIEFESGTGPTRRTTSPLEQQIEQLEDSVKPSGEEQKSAPRASTAAAPPARPPSAATGLLGQAELLMALTHKQQALADTLRLTSDLLAATEQWRQPLNAEIERLNTHVLALSAKNASNDIMTLKQSEAEARALTARHTLVVAALLPLSKQTVVLNLYAASLDRWRVLVGQRFQAAYAIC